MKVLKQLAKTAIEVHATGGRMAPNAEVNGGLVMNRITVYPSGTVSMECVNPSGAVWPVGYFYTVPGLVSERTTLNL